MIWYRNMEQVQADGLEITSGQYERDSFSDEQLNEHASVITNWLKIRAFRYSDAGVYQCFLRSTASGQQQRFPVLSSITYNRPLSAVPSGDQLPKDQPFSNTIYLTVKGELLLIINYDQKKLRSKNL